MPTSQWVLQYITAVNYYLLAATSIYRNMLPHREGDYMLLIVCTALIMTVTGTFDQERQPLGVEMCRYHCGQFNEMTFCVYLSRRLACIATWSKHPLQTYGEEAVYLKVTKVPDFTVNSLDILKVRFKPFSLMLIMKKALGFVRITSVSEQIRLQGIFTFSSLQWQNIITCCQVSSKYLIFRLTDPFMFKFRGKHMAVITSH